MIQKNINSYLKGTLKGNELRKTYYHITKCENCKEVLLDEFSFYTTFNDLDNDLNFNYKSRLNEMLENTRIKIETSDSNKTLKYILYSLFICMFGVVLLIIALKVVYR